eukprot:1137104-Pelagomonas_calceolata.AAC.1
MYAESRQQRSQQCCADDAFICSHVHHGMYFMACASWHVHHGMYIMACASWHVHHGMYMYVMCIMACASWHVLHGMCFMACTSWHVHRGMYIIACTSWHVHHGMYIMAYSVVEGLTGGANFSASLATLTVLVFLSGAPQQATRWLWCPELLLHCALMCCKGAFMALVVVQDVSQALFQWHLFSGLTAGTLSGASLPCCNSAPISHHGFNVLTG